MVSPLLTFASNHNFWSVMFTLSDLEGQETLRAHVRKSFADDALYIIDRAFWVPCQLIECHLANNHFMILLEGDAGGRSFLALVILKNLYTTVAPNSYARILGAQVYADPGFVTKSVSFYHLVL